VALPGAFPTAAAPSRRSAPSSHHHIGEPHHRSPVVLEPKTMPPASHLHSWTGPPGRGPAGLSADRAWQATGPRAIATGRLRPNTMRQILNRFQLFLISEIVSTFQNSQKLVGMSKNYKINFVILLLNYSAQWDSPNSLLCSKFLYKMVRTQIQEYLFTNIYNL
jgi:hypothetical protein